ncbi:hypothetical protein J3458_002225 [Metarhizium acridum]|uniref:Small nuclear ribonucleoprotein SmG n=1 Tax=Metarhizium acridum (strain CQMa 102) TaxID=655827 RepID=E9E5L6_METAQ|nr:small nuclear ribonucleoprotein SmG [Metarhizium acridum CQMa 102]EFY88729.1 small nuclear ribonucleoprotein SmG [Metarhizium acridum CQMa 102]KAG8425536.1 hypothetical protein J3458_002225 [Metarhizium acridum]
MYYSLETFVTRPNWIMLITPKVFLNIVLDEAVEEKEGGDKVKLGMVVIRGNSVVMMEALDRIGGDDRQHHHR